MPHRLVSGHLHHDYINFPLRISTRPLAITDRSGFDGPWTFSPTTFTNDYFKLLFDEKWSWRKWSGPAQFTDSQTKTLMMLPSDMSLTKDKEFKKHAKAYAQDQDLFFKE